jgi:hypothetical protein
MSVGIFVDKNYRPTEADITAAVGPRLALWRALVAEINTTYPAAQDDFKFLYGKKYGWALRFRIKNQLLTSLYPAENGFKVQINLSPEAVDTVLSMGMGANVRQAIEQAYPYPEGRWLFIKVEGDGDLKDIQQLLALRAETKRLL